MHYATDQWDRIKDFLPGREGHVGGTAAITGCSLEAFFSDIERAFHGAILPERFGGWKVVYQRFNRWPRAGFRAHFQLLARDHDNEYMMIDATIVRAHQHSAGAQKRRRASDRSIPRRLTTKIHALVDALGNPVELIADAGRLMTDLCESLLEGVDPEALLGDKAYDADSLIDTLAQRGYHRGDFRQKQIVKCQGLRFRALLANETSSSASCNKLKHFEPSRHATTARQNIPGGVSSPLL